MHIAIVSPSDRSFTRSFLPGIDAASLPIGYPGAPFIGSLVDGYLKQGCAVTALTTTPCSTGEYGTRRWRHGSFEWVVVPERPRSFAMNGRRVGRMVDLFRYEQEELARQLTALQPDVVHAHWSYEFAGAAIKSGLPTLVTVHDNAHRVVRCLPDAYRLARAIMAEVILRRVRWASTVSPYMEPYVQARCRNVKVIPNPVTVSLNDDEVADAIEQRVSGLERPSLVMVSNGWTSLKNGFGGLRVFAVVKRLMPQAHLHLFGVGTEPEGPADRDAEKLGLERTSVSFHGSVSRNALQETVRRCHLLVHPSREESFGMVLAEAMALGVPAIGNRSAGAVPWVIGDQDLLCDFEHPHSVAGTVASVLGSQHVYRQKSLTCFHNVASRFETSVVVRQYMDYLSSIRMSKC